MSLSSQTITIVVTQVATSIANFAASATSVATGSTVTFTGTVVDGAGNGVSGVVLNILDNGSQIETTTSGAGGAFSFQIQFNMAGSFGIKVT